MSHQVLAILSLCVRGHATKCQRDNVDTEDFFTNFVAPLSPDSFFKQHWGKSPVLLQGDTTGRNYSSLFSLNELEALVAQNSTSPKRLLAGEPLQYFKHLRVDVKSIRFELQPSEVVQLPVEGEPVTWPLVKKLRDILARGGTLVIGKVYAFWRPILEFVMALEQYFEVRVHGNIYITSAGFTGRPIHADKNDAFIVQLSGRKRWRVWQPFVEDMLWRKGAGESGMIATNQQERNTWMATQPQLIDSILNPADVLYIPRGFLHEASAPGSQRPIDNTSIHLTVSPELDSWAELLEAMPFIKIAGQPLPPGRSQFRSSGKFMPSDLFEKAASYGGTPQSLRKSVPARLSHHCGKKWFKSMVMQKLHDLDPSMPVKQIKRSFLAYGKKLKDAGYSDDAIQDLCLAFVARLRRDLLSERTQSTTSLVGDLDRPWCVQSAVAARIVPDWLTLPGFKPQQNRSYVVHSRMNGPSRYKNLESDSASPFTVPSNISKLFVASLHVENNPSSVVWPHNLVAQASPADRKQVHIALQQMLALDILQPQYGDVIQSEL